jgi:hypothetical protein
MASAATIQGQRRRRPTPKNRADGKRGSKKVKHFRRPAGCTVRTRDPPPPPLALDSRCRCHAYTHFFGSALPICSIFWSWPCSPWSWVWLVVFSSAVIYTHNGLVSAAFRLMLARCRVVPLLEVSAECRGKREMQSDICRRTLSDATHCACSPAAGEHQAKGG